MNEAVYRWAEIATEVAMERGLTVDAKWLYCQWMHETGYMTNWGAIVANNFGGLKQFRPQPEWFDGDATSPEGDPYQVFESPYDYALYFGKYITLYKEDGIYEATTMEEYITCLKNGGYFGAGLEEYINGCNAVWNETFA